MKKGDAKLKGLPSCDEVSQLPSKIKETNLMSNYQFLTPEEKQRKKQRNKTILYASLLLSTVVISALVTILANQI